MVSPEGTSRERTSRRAGRASLIGSGVAVLAVGAIALGSLTSPTSEAAPDTTTTTMVDRLDSPIDLENFSVDQIERGSPFRWQVPLTVTGTTPLAVIDHGGWIYVFSSDLPARIGNDGGGLNAWRSADGEDWEDLGAVIDQAHVIVGVESTGQGLVALEGGLPGADPAVWASDDGVVWTRDLLPVGGDGANDFVSPQSVGGNERMLIVAGGYGSDIYSMMQSRISEIYPELDASRYGWSTDIGPGGEITFKVWGPLGFVLVEISGEDLSLTAEEIEAITDEHNYIDPEVDTWVSQEEGVWITGEIDGASWIETITFLDDGTILAAGGGNSGPSVWESTDGLTWEPMGLASRPSRIESWNGQLVGPSNAGIAQVYVSDDGDEWDQIGPYEHFPIPIQWHLDQLASGPAGIAGLVSGWEPGDPNANGVARDNPAVLTAGEATLTLDLWSSTYELETPEKTIRWVASGGPAPDGVTVDLDAGAVDFADPETGVHLATFTLEEISAAEDEYWSSNFNSQTDHRAFVFSRDGVEWDIDDIGSVLGDGYMRDLVVSEDLIVALTVDMGTPFSAVGSSGFEVWSATIP